MKGTFRKHLIGAPYSILTDDYGYRRIHNGTAPLSEGERSIEEVVSGVWDYLAALGDESDRGAAVLAAAQFEHDVEDAIARRFGISEIDDEAKSRRGVLKRQIRSFAAKIDVAYAVGLCDQDTYEGLRTVLEIRNRFAHLRGPLSFGHRPVADLCRKLDTKRVPKDSDDLRARYLTYVMEAQQKIALSSFDPPFR